MRNGEGKMYRKWVLLLQWWELQKYYYIISGIENTQIEGDGFPRRVEGCKGVDNRRWGVVCVSLPWGVDLNLLSSTERFARLTAHLRFPSEVGSKLLSWAEVIARCPVHNKEWYWRATQWVTIFGEWGLSSSAFFFYFLHSPLPPSSNCLCGIGLSWSWTLSWTKFNTSLPLKFCG